MAWLRAASAEAISRAVSRLLYGLGLGITHVLARWPPTPGTHTTQKKAAGRAGSRSVARSSGRDQRLWLAGWLFVSRRLTIVIGRSSTVVEARKHIDGIDPDLGDGITAFHQEQRR